MRRTLSCTSFSIAALGVAVLLALATPARAQSTGSFSFNYQQCQTSVQQALTHTAQVQTQAAMQVSANAPPIDLKTNYCWKNINQAFTNLGNSTNGILAILSGGINISGILNSVANQLLNQVCSAVAGDINQIGKMVGSSIANTLCVPLPSLNLSGSLNLGLGGAKSCGGASLIQLQSLSGTSVPPQDFWNMFNQPSQ